MHVGWKIAAGAAVGIGAAALLAACTGGPKTDGPMGELSGELMKKLDPGWRGSGLSLATQSLREVKHEDGSVRGVYDGTRLLAAADAHAYGTPTIIDPATDVQGDGKATFNEVRHVVRHFDTDESGAFSWDEERAFRNEVGIAWVTS